MNENWRLIKYIFLLEARSFTRSKYLRFSILHSYLFVPIALFIIKNKESGSDDLLTVFWICILAATPAIGISAFSFSKDGFFYQGLVTRNIPLRIYVEAKLLFITIYSGLFYCCLLPYMLSGRFFVLSTFAAGTFYYVGFGGMIMLYYSSFDRHKVNLNSSPFFNYESFSVFKILLTFPITCPLFFAEKTRHWGIVLMFLFGVCGLILFNFFVRLITRNLTKRKYSFLSLSAHVSN